MQYCTACKKSIATIHILDLKDGSIADQKHLCANCAEKSGLVQQKTSPLSSEMLDLIGSIKTPEPETGKGQDTACPHCGLTVGEFRVRGRMGCPNCYEVFRNSLVPVLERVHDSTCHRGRIPGQGTSPPSGEAAKLAALRQRLAAAVGQEDYEEAASLRDQIKNLEKSPEETKESPGETS